MPDRRTASSRGTGSGRRAATAGATTPSTEETGRILAAARRYYFDDASKVQIAQELGISRFQVARLLQEARRTGLVRIEIGSPGHVDDDLSRRVADRLDIDRAIVIEAHPNSPQATFDLVGAALAAELERVVSDGDTIGLAWSRAAPAMARSLRSLEQCTVVQLSGAIYPPAGLPGSVEVTRDVAAAAGGDAYILYAPLVVPDVETAAGLRRQPEIAATLAKADDLDVAVLSVGAWTSGGSAVYGLLDDAELETYEALGVEGEVTGRLFDRDGVPIPNPLDDRVVGATIDQLRDARTLITSGSGVLRRDATLSIARAGLIHTLIIDDALARALLS